MNKIPIVINLIQDLATPHNNVLIEQFAGREDVKIKLWYAQAQNNARYQWSGDISQKHSVANIYGTRLNVSFLLYCLTHSHERFVIVGWMNTNTRLLHLLFFLLRRPFNHWSDLPNPIQEGMTLNQRFLRWSAYKLLRYSRSKVFVVGKVTMDCFRAWGYPENMLVNLPIFVSLSDDLAAYRNRYGEIFKHYEVPQGGFLISAGSRLIFLKGYDLLIKAVADLTHSLRKKIKLVIVGFGEEKASLDEQIADLRLQDIVKIENWMEIEDFKAVIANSDIFLHPARFDSYGGTILGMALGVSVIGSTGAGAAVDRIEHGFNGLLYEPNDTKTLTKHIETLLNDELLRKRMALAGQATASQWPPSRGVEILLNHTI